MASVQFDGGKCHGAGEAKAMLRHADKDERLIHEHSNEDIDKTRTPLNTDLHGLSYGDMCERYDKAIEGYQQRASKAIRKDAVTLYDAIITVPKDLPAEREDDWYRDVEKAINDHYGKTVVMDIKIHRDEIHEYTDPATKQKVMSRTHGHCFMIPDVDGRLNAKKFSSRANMRSLNREIDELTREKYHVQFLTGEKAVDRGFQTVEQLKRAADNEELIRQTEQSRQSRDVAKTEQQAAEQSRDRAAKQARQAEQQRQQTVQQAEQAKADKVKQQQAAQKAREDAQKAQEAVSQLRTEESTLTGRIASQKGEYERLSEQTEKLISYRDTAKQQRLDALRERDAARADLNVTKQMQQLAATMKAAKKPEVEILRETDAKTTMLGKEMPATVTIRRDDFEQLRQTAGQLSLMQQLVKQLEQMLAAFREWAAKAFTNKIDAREILVDQKVQEVQADLDKANRQWGLWEQDSKGKDQTIEELRERADLGDRFEQIREAFPKTIERLERIAAMEQTFDQRGLGKKPLREYKELCEAAHIKPREDMSEALERKERSRGDDWDLSL